MTVAEKIQFTIAVITGVGVLVTVFTPILQAAIQYKNRPKLDILPTESCNKTLNGDRYIRVKIQNLGKLTAKNVRAKVCWEDGEQIPPIPVSWTHTNTLNCDYIGNLVAEYVDIAIDYANQTDFKLTTYLNAADSSTTRTTNDVSIRIIAYADNANLVTKTIHFKRNLSGEMHGVSTEI